MESSGTAGDGGMVARRGGGGGVRGLFIQRNEAGALSTAQISSSVYAKCHAVGSAAVLREVQKPIFLAVCRSRRLLDLFYSPVRPLLRSTYHRCGRQIIELAFTPFCRSSYRIIQVATTFISFCLIQLHVRRLIFLVHSNMAESVIFEPLLTSGFL